MNKDFKWITRDGRELKLEEIGDNHLLNIMKMLQTQKETGATCIRGNVWGNEIDAWEEEIWDYEEEETLNIIIGEVKKRGIKYE